MQFSRSNASSSGRFPVRTILVVIAVLCVIWINFFQAQDLYVSNFSTTNNKIEKEALQPLSSSSSLETTTTPLIAKLPSFLEIAKATGTDKVEAHQNLAPCLNRGSPCVYPDDKREVCRPWGHFYDTIYQRWLAPYLENKKPVQFLEVGFFQGSGYEAYSKFLAPNQQAELHSMEISCRGGDKDNSAAKHPWYQKLLDSSMLHCGDASNYDFLHDTWINKMKRNGEGPPLMVVVDDGSHYAQHMAASLFFWFPRIEPGGILVVEDIQPIPIANKFRTHIVPQVMKDLHWCGGPKLSDSLCFPTIQPFLQGVHCEMHICVFQRNDKPSVEPSREDSLTPADAFTNANKCLFGPHE